MNNQKMLVGLFAGVAVGAALGILFAPEKGSEMRKKISTKGGDYTQNLKDKFGNLISSATDQVENVKSKINEFTGGQAENSGSQSNGNGQSRSNKGADATTV
jgi:gas vesicle protein